MKRHRVVWLLLLFVSVEAKMRGELQRGAFKRRSLMNIFDAAELKKTLAKKRTAYQDPFRDEPRAGNIPLPSRANNAALQREFRNKAINNRQGRDGHETAEPEPEPEVVEAEPEPEPEAPVEAVMDEVVMDEPSLVLSTGKGWSRRYSKSRKGKGKGKGRSKSRKSKSKGKGRSQQAPPPQPAKSTSSSRSMGMRRSKSRSMPVIIIPSPTFAPTPQVTVPETDAPTVTPVITDKPTCSPTTTFFPPDVSGFFGTPNGDDSDLQNELDNALNEIQVPSEFVEQCVE